MSSLPYGTDYLCSYHSSLIKLTFWYQIRVFMRNFCQIFFILSLDSWQQTGPAKKPLIQCSIMEFNSCSVQLQMSMVKRASRGIKAIPQMTPPCGLRAISGQSGAISGQKGKWQERQWTGYWSINGRSICIGSVSRRGNSDEDNLKNCTCNDLCILLVWKEQGRPERW